MADKFESFNKQVEIIQQYPLLTVPDLEDRFRQLDRLIKLGTHTILDTTHFVEDNICYRLSEIVIGSIKAKIYRGRFVKDRRGAGLGITVGAQNSKILGAGFDLFKLSRAPRDLAVPLVLRVLRSIRLQNIVYEQILRAFDASASDYRRTCDALALQEQKLRLAEEAGADNLVPLMHSISDLIDEKENTESKIGCMDSNMVYGTVGLVHYYLKQINKLQEEIIQAYMRSVPKIVRSFARSDLDALDMLQVGYVGLMHAVKAYDFRSRHGFASFSRYWIRQRIQAFMKSSGGSEIKLSPNVWEDYQKFTGAERKLRAARPGEQILRADVAAELEWSVKKVESIIEKVAMCQVVSLDDEPSLMTESGEYVEYEATIADTREEDIEAQRQHQEQVRDVVQNLSPEDRRLICLRFGCVELIENNRLDADEVLEELFRQLACKALVQQHMAERIDVVQSVPLPDSLL